MPGKNCDIIPGMGNTEEIIGSFSIPGELISIKANTHGHINSTFISTFSDGGKQVKYTHQRINKSVFPHPDEVMENITAVTEHIRRKTGKENSTLTVVPARDGKPYSIDKDGEYWRTYIFIDDAASYDRVPDENIAYNLGKGIGDFQNTLSDFPSSSLRVVIPRFHDMGMRFEQLRTAVRNDSEKRLASVEKEVSFLFDNEKRGSMIWNAYADKTLPWRVTHNDTKINNVLFSNTTGEAVCVIDLDTIMPGTALFDTGDMIRTACSTADEDEKDTEKMEFSIPLYKALISGYMEEAHSFLTEDEKSLIKESGRMMAQIMAVRFLTDYLQGDTYYRTEYPEHNLARARTQIKLIQSMDTRWREF